MGTTLNAIRNRPRFKLKTTLTPEKFTEDLKLELEKEKNQYIAIISLQESYIEVKTDDEPIWKPRLTLRAEVEPEDGVYIRGIFGPRPSIWTFFMFLYICFGTMFFLFGSLYLSMQMIKTEDEPVFPWALITTLVSLLGMILTYIAVKVGQIRSKDQMSKLRRFAEEIIVKYEKEDFLKA